MTRNQFEQRGPKTYVCPFCKTEMEDSIEALQEHRKDDGECDRMLADIERSIGVAVEEKEGEKTRIVMQDIPEENLGGLYDNFPKRKPVE